MELRISVFPTVRGEKIVVRIFDPSNRTFELSSLGFEDDTLKTLMRTLWQSGLCRVTQGQTTLEEILRVVVLDQSN